MSKEQAYDTDIAPLMTKLIEMCDAHKINMFATFVLRADEDGMLTCSTAIPANDESDLDGRHLVNALWCLANRAPNP